MNLDVIVCKGFNVGKNGQSKIPQFFAQGSDAVNKPPVNATASASMKAKSSPEATPRLQKKTDWYWSEIDGEWYKIGDTLDIEKASRLNSIIEEDSNTISPEEEAQISAEVHEVMAQKCATSPRQLGPTPVMQNSSKSGTAISDTNVIDLITQSITSLQQSQPAVFPGSPISLASTSGATMNATRFSHISSNPHSSPPTSNFRVNALEAKGITVFCWA